MAKWNASKFCKKMKSEVEKMILSAYCLSYGNWTVIPSQWEHVFADMREIGFDAVDLSFCESEAVYSMRTFEQQLNLAHKHGLKVFVIPSRFGGRFAGAPLMPSLWLNNHPECQVPGHPFIGCLDSPAFLDFSEGFIRKIVTSFGIDGIIWDEPKDAETICLHPDTIRKYGKTPTRENMFASLIEYLTRLTHLAKEIRPSLCMTVFNMPHTPPEFTKQCSLISGIDFTGFDGTCCEQSYFHESPRRVKPTVRQMWKRIREEARNGTFALIENILIPDSELKPYEEELLLTLQEVRPDHLSCYYYGHNNESAERIQKFTMDAVSKIIHEHK